MSVFAGFVQQESTINGVLLTKDNTPTPKNADALPTFRVYADTGFLVNGTASLLDSGTITNATNATPIAITSANHGLSTGARVTVAGVLGNTAANTTTTITKVDANTFTLDGTVGNGPYTSGGTWNVTGAYRWSVAALGANGFAAGLNYTVLHVFAVGAVQKGDLDTFGVT